MSQSSQLPVRLNAPTITSAVFPPAASAPRSAARGAADRGGRRGRTGGCGAGFSYFLTAICRGGSRPPFTPFRRLYTRFWATHKHGAQQVFTSSFFVKSSFWCCCICNRRILRVGRPIYFRSAHHTPPDTRHYVSMRPQPTRASAQRFFFSPIRAAPPRTRSRHQPGCGPGLVAVPQAQTPGDFCSCFLPFAICTAFAILPSPDALRPPLRCQETRLLLLFCPSRRTDFAL
jgi:hypothetical protein